MALDAICVLSCADAIRVTSRPTYETDHLGTVAEVGREHSTLHSSTRRRRHKLDARSYVRQTCSLGTSAAEAGLRVVARVDSDHFELPADAVELLRQVRPADRQWFIEEVTGALAIAAKTKDFWPLQEVLEAWTVTVRLQQQLGSAAMIQRMQRRERGVPVDLDQLRRPRG
jgi:hypothetical protein